MTMLDEELLRAALSGAADGFAVSDPAAEHILREARDLDARPRAVPRLKRRLPVETIAPNGPDETSAEDETLPALQPRGSRPKRLFGAVAAVVVLLGLSLAGVATLGRSSSSSPAVSATPSTTVPIDAHGGVSGALPSGAGSGQSAARGAPGLTPTASPSAPSSGKTASPPLPSGAVGQSSKVEETGSVDLTVGKGRLERVLTSLTNLAVANGGFAANTATQSGGTSDTPSYGSITLQVPQASFGTVVAQAHALGTVTSLTTKGTDVTGQYVDLQARIGALQASRDQYLTIMSKATSIGDILAVQNQLDSLQTQLEQLQGQLQVLDSQTTYGTLTVSVSESGAHRPTPPVPRPASGIGDAWHGAVSGFAAAFDGLVRIAGPTLFVLLCVSVLVVVGRVAWRGVRRRTL